MLKLNNFVLTASEQITWSYVAASRIRFANKEKEKALKGMLNRVHEKSKKSVEVRIRFADSEALRSEGFMIGLLLARDGINVPTLWKPETNADSDRLLAKAHGIIEGYRRGKEIFA